MGEELAKLKIVLEATTAPLKKELNKAKQEIRDTVDMVKGKIDGPEVKTDKTINELKKIREEFRKTVSEISSEETDIASFKNVFSEFKKIREDLMNGELTGFATDNVKGFIKKAKLDVGIFEHTDEYEKSANDLERAEKALERLQAKERDMQALGIKKESEEAKRLQQEISKAIRLIDKYNAKRLRMEGLGYDVQLSGNNLSSGSWIQSAGAVAGAMKSSVSEKLAGIRQSITDTIKRIPVIGRVATESAYIASKAFGGMRAVMQKIGPAIKKVSGIFGALIQKFRTGISVINPFKSKLKQTNNTMGGGIKNILKYTLGIRSLFVLMNRIRGAITEGFKNLAQYSDSTNASLSTLMSSLTQLKNALATAFAPILNAIAPVIDFFIQKIITAVNALGQFFGALTGQTSYVRAKKVNQDYAASLVQNAKGADKARKANEKLKRTLLGFDQIHKMDDKSSSDSDGLSPSDMFENQGIDSSVSDFAKRIKNAWEKADFTEIGTIVGRKLNNTLSNIPWGKIKETSRRIARSIATFLNGFIKTTDWNLVGDTFAQGLNTVIEFGHTFFSTFDWKSFGKSLSDGVNGFVQNFEWKTAAEALSAKLKGILDATSAFLENVDWWNLGEQIWTFIKNVDWKGIAKSAFELVGAAFGATFKLAAFIGSLFADGISKAKDYIVEHFTEAGKWTWEGFKKGIVDVVSDVGSWIYEHILQPFLTGFKRAFGINSPSTVMAEQGNFIVEGLYCGILDKEGKLLQWFKELPKKIIGSMGNLWDAGKRLIQSFIDGFKSLSIPTPHFETNGTYKIAGINTPIPKMKVRWYASGGFPNTGEMFVARESGPELVGRMGNRSAVANNGQIIEGIKAGVFEAVMDAFTAAGQFFGGGGENQVVLELTLMCDSETAYRIVRKGKQKYEGRYSIVETI